MEPLQLAFAVGCAPEHDCGAVVAGPAGGIEPAIFGHLSDARAPGGRLDGAMEQTATAAQQQPGRFARLSADPPPAPVAAPPPAAALAPQPDLAATRAIARRWPRTVPPKRVFPRG
jgi:hypothetical protein